MAQDFQKALQRATQSFKFKFEFSEYRFERVKERLPIMEEKISDEDIKARSNNIVISG